MEADDRVEAALRAAPEPPLDLERATAELAARAESEGLVEVAFAELDSPLGTLLAAGSERGLLRLAYPGPDGEQRELERLAAAVGARVLRSPRRLDPVRRELAEYFEGGRRDFDLPLDWALVGGFPRRVLEATARIPYGETRTYAEVAADAGSPRAYRAAGNALAANPLPIVVPCHRVLRSGGGLGGYGGGLGRKRRLLSLESARADA